MLQRIKKISTQSWVSFIFYGINLVMVVLLMFSMGVRTVVRGHSMDPTLQDGNSYIAVPCTAVQPGDIVMVDSVAFKTYIVKRVIAVPGDTLGIYDNVVYRNGLPLWEAYIAEAMDTEDIPAFRLGEGEYFVMGDNRNHSADSRNIGTVSREEITHTVVMEGSTPLLIRLAALLVFLAFGAVYIAETETLYVMKLVSKIKKKEKENPYE